MSLLLLAPVLPGLAQQKVAFTYGADFQYYFDNKEYDRGGNLYESSGTIHAARLTPTIGVTVGGKGTSHNLAMGLDVMKNMGESPTSVDDEDLQNKELIREMIFWYNLERGRSGRLLSMYAGIFPRRFSVFGGQYPYWEYSAFENIPTLFISESNRFYDNNIEGVLLKYRTRRGYCEAGLDWMGMIGHQRRERFQIFTYGDFGLGGDFLHAGWTGTMYHFANTLEYRGVVDNVLVSPFVLLTSGRKDFRWSAKLAYIQGIHQDRVRETGLDLSCGGQLTLDFAYRSFGVLNDIYYGTGQMPYFDWVDAGGKVYGSDLYPGSRFYRIRTDGKSWRHSGCYNRSEVYWQPRIADFVSLRLSAVFHFTGDGFQGSQQKLGVVFDLEKAMKGKDSRRTGSSDGTRKRRNFEIFL